MVTAADDDDDALTSMPHTVIMIIATRPLSGPSMLTSSRVSFLGRRNGRPRSRRDDLRAFFSLKRRRSITACRYLVGNSRHSNRVGCRH